MTVLSQLRTLTVDSDTSTTSPLALCFGTTIQSPLRSILLAVSCTLATRPRIVSLKTSISTAADAPKAVRIATGVFPMRMLRAIITATPITISLNIWKMPFTAYACSFPRLVKARYRLSMNITRIITIAQRI